MRSLNLIYIYIYIIVQEYYVAFGENEVLHVADLDSCGPSLANVFAETWT